jgi:hypothetical protein
MFQMCYLRHTRFNAMSLNVYVNVCVDACPLSVIIFSCTHIFITLLCRSYMLVD